MIINSFMGIDPGKTGAIAVVRGRLLRTVYDSPLVDVDGKSGFDHEQMSQLLIRELCVAQATGGELYAIIEQQHAFPRQGGVGNFTGGYGYGLWIGMLQAYKIPRLIITTMGWRKIIFTQEENDAVQPRVMFPKARRLSKEQAAAVRAARKASSMKKALQLCAGAREYITLQKHEGRAEAVCIAYAGIKRNPWQTASR